LIRLFLVNSFYSQLGSAALSELFYGLAHIKIHLENSTRTKDLLHPYEQYESLLLLLLVVVVF
jgi:hypothetical protein